MAGAGTISGRTGGEGEGELVEKDTDGGEAVSYLDLS